MRRIRWVRSDGGTIDASLLPLRSKGTLMNKAVLFLAAAALALGSLSAHEAHEVMLHAQQTAVQAGETVKQVAKDAQSVAGSAQDAVAGAMDKAEAVAQSKPADVLKRSLDSHWHNKIVHFPVALGIFGVIFFVLSLRWAQYLWPSRLLLLSAILGGLAAILTGGIAAEEFRGTSMMETIHAHAKAGKLSMILLALMLLLTWFPSFKKWSWAVGLLAIAVLAVAGALGGALAAS